jgi:5-methylcytosine-specific restriction endonuclease McrA
MKYCLAEITDGRVSRIYKGVKDVVLHSPEHSLIVGMLYNQAIFDLRQQVYDRAKGQCERCGKNLTWKQMHMDERVSRGQGGILSLGNCWCLCADCHILRPESEHGERRWGGGSKEA